MRITADLLRLHGACQEQCAAVAALWPDGAEPTIDVLTEAAANGLDPWWLWRLLPAEGPGSQRAYALWCAEQVAHLCSDPRVARCLAVVRRRVERPNRVPGTDLAAASAAASATASAAAWATAWDAAWAAAGAAAWAAARAAAGAAAWATDRAAREAQLACLSDLLLAAETTP